MIVIPLVCIGIAFIGCHSGWRYSGPQYRAPLGVYIGSYLVTTVFGATVLGLGGREGVQNFGLATMFPDATAHSGYWVLLYAPMTVVPIVSLILVRRGQQPSGLTRLINNFNCDVSLGGYYCVFLLFTMYCVVYMDKFGFLSNITWAATVAGEYQTLISQRAAMAGSLGTLFFGVVYTTLPTLSSIALYQTMKRRTLGWSVAFAMSVATITLLSLSTIQKAPLMVYFFGCCLALLILGIARKLLIVAVAVGLAVLSVLQLLFQSDWTPIDTLNLILFRVASSFPFYATLFPSVLPHQGFGYGLGMLGFGTRADDNLIVFDYMYPNIRWVQGAAAAPAHMRAFAAGGYIGAIAVLLLIGLFVILVGKLRACIRGPLVFALYMQGLTAMYYLTQTSVRGVLVESYGLGFAIVAVLPLWVYSNIVPVNLQRECVRRREPGRFANSAIPNYRRLAEDASCFRKIQFSSKHLSH
jgi:hypothetical protein